MISKRRQGLSGTRECPTELHGCVYIVEYQYKSGTKRKEEDNLFTDEDAIPGSSKVSTILFAMLSTGPVENANGFV